MRATDVALRCDVAQRKGRNNQKIEPNVEGWNATHARLLLENPFAGEPRGKYAIHVEPMPEGVPGVLAAE